MALEFSIQIVDKFTYRKFHKPKLACRKISKSGNWGLLPHQEALQVYISGIITNHYL